MILGGALLVFAYIVGSIPTGLWLGMMVAGIDVRTVGSRRMGATNVQRSLGVKLGVAVLLIDIAKGVTAVLVTRAVSGSDRLAAVAGVVAVCGHIWPVFANFRGGRGAATAAGAVLALAPLSLAVVALVMIGTVAVTRYVSLGSIAGALVVGPAVAFFLPLVHGSDAAVPASIVIAALVIYKHSDNIQRLRHGTESKLGARAVTAPSTPR